MRLMIFETAYQRLSGELALYGETLECLILTADRRVMRKGSPIELADAQCDAVWATFDVFGGAEGRAYFSRLIPAARARWVHSSAAGFDGEVFKDVVRSGAALTTSHGQAIGMSEYVMAGVLDHFQRGPIRRDTQREAAWRRTPYREIMGTTWLILGFGAIGQNVAQRARAFGARIIALRREQSPHALADRIVALETVREAAAQADVVVMCLPLRKNTRKLADAAFFAVMKEDSVFVNLGRGACVDEAALLAALDAGQPSHAVLDVFETEPLPADHRFWRHPRVAMTPHSSPMSDGQGARNDALFLENLRRFAVGEKLLNVARPDDVLQG